MPLRQRTGSVVCRSCGSLVGVADDRCYQCGARNPALWGYSPLLRRLGADLGFVKIVFAGCIGLFVAALLLSPEGIRFSGLMSLLSPAVESQFLLGAAGKVPVWDYGRWWTVLSAGWLHGGLLHIFFNLYWVRILIPPVAKIYGPGRMVIIYVAASVVGFALSSLVPVAVLAFAPGLTKIVATVMGFAQFTLGASAALMGLLGALVHYGRRGGSSELGRWAWGYAIFFFVFGLIVPGIDNWGHLGGFLGGYGAAVILDPLKPERLDHLVTALVLLGLTALSVVVSVLTGLSLLRG